MKLWHYVLLFSAIGLLALLLWTLLPSDYAIKARLGEYAIIAGRIFVWIGKAILTCVVGLWLTFGGFIIGSFVRGVGITFADYKLLPKSHIPAAAHWAIAITSSILVVLVWIITLAPLVEWGWTHIPSMHDAQYESGPFWWGVLAGVMYLWGYWVARAKNNEYIDFLASLVFIGPLKDKFPDAEQREYGPEGAPRRTSWR